MSRFLNELTDTAEEVLKDKGYVRYDELARTHYKPRAVDSGTVEAVKKALPRVADLLRERDHMITLVTDFYFKNRVTATSDRDIEIALDVARRCLPWRTKSTGLHMTSPGEVDYIYAASRKRIGDAKYGGVIVEKQRIRQAEDQRVVPVLSFNQEEHLAIFLRETPLLGGPKEDEEDKD